MDLRDLARWNPDALEGLGADLDGRAEELNRIAGDIRRAATFGGAWTGGAADAAAISLRTLVDAVDVQADSYRRVSACAAVVVPQLRALHTELAAAHTWADEHGLVIEADGALIEAPDVSESNRTPTAVHCVRDSTRSSGAHSNSAMRQHRCSRAPTLMRVPSRQCSSSTPPPGFRR